VARVRRDLLAVAHEINRLQASLFVVHVSEYMPQFVSSNPFKRAVRLRNKAGLTQEQLAELAGISAR